MVFLAGLDGFKASVPTSLGGLELAEEVIDGVIATIDDELGKIRPEEFGSRGTISRASFGGADSAPTLALHHSRAHEVIRETLGGLKQDLQTFQQACRDAKKDVIAADENSADRLRHVRTAVERLQDGSTSRQGERDHSDAQQNQDVTGGVDL